LFSLSIPYIENIFKMLYLNCKNNFDLKQKLTILMKTLNNLFISLKMKTINLKQGF